MLFSMLLLFSNASIWSSALFWQVGSFATWRVFCTVLSCSPISNMLKDLPLKKGFMTAHNGDLPFNTQRDERLVQHALT